MKPISKITALAIGLASCPRFVFRLTKNQGLDKLFTK